MALIEIKHWNGKILHTIEADSIKAAVEALVRNGANLNMASLDGANLNRANLNGASLDGANLNRANLNRASLNGASLDGANLNRANLNRASYGDGIPLTKTPIMISGLIWPIMILDMHLKIGCELHSFVEWEAFTDKEISYMEKQALAWWKQHKEFIFAVIKACR
jgi:hypothetical protein